MTHHVCPVIHVTDIYQIRRNIDIAIKAGAEKVFLINHDLHAADLTTMFREVRPDYPDLWIGLNLLGVPGIMAAKMAKGADGLWLDRAPTSAINATMPVLGGVAFKYQDNFLTMGEQVWKAGPYTDILVTSGVATGMECEVSKVQELRTLAGGKPTGLASGLTVQNVRSYLPWVDWFLVATGVSSSFTQLCPHKLTDFVQTVKG